MLTVQRKYLSYVNDIQKDIADLNIPIDTLVRIGEEIKRTELLIPIIGAFSAGKSTFINSFLGKDYLPVGLTPETSLATEIRFSEKEYIEAVKPDDSFVDFAINEIHTIKSRAHEFKFLRLYINSIKIKEITPLVLVDMPGFDSPLDLHNQAIMNYINKGVFYFVLTSVEEGSITRSVLRQLSDIREFRRDFAFFLSKTNLRGDTEVKDILQKMEEQLFEHFEISRKVSPIGENSGESLKLIIGEINPESLFKNIFNDELKNNYYRIVDTINVSISAFKKSKSENEAAILELKNGIKKIIQKRDKMLQEAKEKYSETNINRIVDAVGRELSNSADELVNSALSGGQDSLSKNISEMVRHLLIDNVRSTMGEISSNVIDDFSVELRDIDKVMAGFAMDDKWLEKITSATKLIFDKTNIAFQDLGGKDTSTGNATKLYKTVSTVLAVTTTVIAPVLEIILIFLPDILSFIFESQQKKKQTEHIRNQILTSVIPSIKRELRGKLPTIFSEQINNLIKEVGAEFENVLLEKQEVISKQEEEKMNLISSIEEKIAFFNTIKDKITISANSVLFS